MAELLLDHPRKALNIRSLWRSRSRFGAFGSESSVADRLIALCTVLLACGMSVIAQAGETLSISPLTADEQAAVSGIDERSVTSTVSFLASDEMAGRNTPSIELNIASAYVASRFRGAGLEGLSADGKFYQTTELTQFSPAAGGSRLLIDNVSVPVSAVLIGMSEPTIVSGPLTEATSALDQKYSGPVYVSEIPLPPQASGNPSSVLAMWSRRVKPLVAQGATAVLVRISRDSLLSEIAEQLSETPVTIPPQFEFGCPVVLVEDSTPKSGQVDLTVPANIARVSEVHNVIGVLRGSDPELSKQAVIVSAHLDHIGLRPGGADTINNGADDNATGVTAVLTMADAFSALTERPRRSVVFMTFWGEEKGLLGSKYYVSKPLWPLEQTVANVNIEMIGRPEREAEGKAWGTGWIHSDLGDLMAAGAARAGVTIFHHEKFSEMLYQRSDNDSFVRAGVIAHSFSAGSLHDDYHQPTDEVSKLDLSHMTKVIQGLFAGILPIAQAEVTPAKAAVKEQK